MNRAPKPGFWLVARRECRWLLHDRAALILIFGVPLFAFAVLTAVFSHPVIRGLGVVVVDADQSNTSRAFVEQVAASPNLGIVERAGDLASAARAIRAGGAIAAVYIPANFERDLKAEFSLPALQDADASAPSRHARQKAPQLSFPSHGSRQRPRSHRDSDYRPAGREC